MVILYLSCGTAGCYFVSGSGRAARQLAFLLRGAVVLHDSLFFRFGILSCGTAACFFASGCFRAARLRVFSLRHPFVRHDRLFFTSGILSCSTIAKIEKIYLSRAACSE